MTAKQALAKVRIRLEAHRDEYLKAAAAIVGATDTEWNERRANQVWASCMSEALVEVGNVEKQLSK